MSRRLCGADPGRKGSRRMSRRSRSLLRSFGCGLAAALLCLLVVGCAAPSPSGLSPVPRSSYSCSALSTAVARAPTAAQTPPVGTTHQTYMLTLLILPLQETFNPGNNLKISWCPVPGPPTTMTQPALEVVSVQLIGPYPSKSAADAAELGSALTPPPSPVHPPAPAGPMVASTTPIHTTTWNNAVQSVTLTLPSTLRTGYYIVWSNDDTTPPPVPTAGPGTVAIGPIGSGGGGGGRVIAVTNSPILP
jgi:hypothetical protein